MIFRSLMNRYQDYMPLRRQDSGSQGSPSKRSMRAVIILLSLVALLTISIFLSNIGAPSNVRDSPVNGIASQSHPWTKPAGLKIVALIFYGRRANVQILERYLRVMDRIYGANVTGEFG
jgi:hypothetical protein